jgi:hypothetical protein
MTTLERKLIEKVEYHQKMERLARVWKNSTVSYHKTKFPRALQIMWRYELRLCRDWSMR